MTPSAHAGAVPRAKSDPLDPRRPVLLAALVDRDPTAAADGDPTAADDGDPTAAADGDPTAVHDDHDPPRTVDVRLVAPAVVAWLAALAVVRAPPGAALLAAGLCGVAALVVGAATGGLGRRADAPGTGRRAARRHRRGSGGLAPVVALAALAAAAVLGAGGAQTHARAQGLLDRLVDERSTASLTGRVVGEPVVMEPAWPGAPPRARCVVALESVADHGRTSEAVGQVLVLGPSTLTSVAYGARLRVTGRVQPGAPGARVVALLLTSADPEVLADPSRWDARANGVRDDVAGLAARLPGDAGALLPGVTVGDTSGVPSDLVAAMRVAGLTHVTAVSGAHFSLVAVLVLTVATALRVPRRARAALVVAAMAAMVVLVHPSPSVVRAAAMGLVAVVGLLLGRPHRAPAALCTSVVVLLVTDPWLAAELGFILSVLATGGLVLLGGPLAERWSARCGRPVAQALALPVAAQLVCAPAILLATPSVALYAVPANLLAAPAVAPATVLGLAAAVLAPWCPPAAHVLALGSGAACWWIGTVARTASAAPGAQLAWLPGPWGVVVLGATGLCAVRLLVGRRRG